MSKIQIYIAVAELIIYIGLLIFAFWIGREYDQLSKFKNNTPKKQRHG
jgi:hypothetical protein